MKQTTLCYIEDSGKYLMLHRTKKSNDENKDKWIGIGGHFENDESPEECMLREVKEETGLTLLSWRFCGVITFVSSRVDYETEYMYLFSSDLFKGEMTECDEGVLEWIDIQKLDELDLWEGDRIFLDLMKKRKYPFLLKLMYDDNDALVYASLDGQMIKKKN